MIQLDEAHEIAQRWAHDFHPDATVRLEPFELGYVAYRTTPEYAGRASRITDAEVSIVIDGDTGEIAPFAALPVASIVHLYTAQRVAEQRFPAALKGLLSLSGWRPARDIGTAVDGWWSRNAPAGKKLPMSVREVVAEFGGLQLLPVGLSFVPQPTPRPVELLTTGAGNAVVIGELRKGSVAIDEDGGVWLSGEGVPHKVADSFDAALPHLLGVTD
ncbi:SUKH-3 domain-containing protein [Micromonospora sp. NPDC003197]